MTTQVLPGSKETVLSITFDFLHDNMVCMHFSHIPSTYSHLFDHFLCEADNLSNGDLTRYVPYKNVFSLSCLRVL